MVLEELSPGCSCRYWNPGGLPAARGQGTPAPFPGGAWPLLTLFSDQVPQGTAGVTPESQEGFQFAPHPTYTSSLLLLIPQLGPKLPPACRGKPTPPVCIYPDGEAIGRRTLGFSTKLRPVPGGLGAPIVSEPQTLWMLGRRTPFPCV